MIEKLWKYMGCPPTFRIYPSMVITFKDNKPIFSTHTLYDYPLPDMPYTDEATLVTLQEIQDGYTIKNPYCKINGVNINPKLIINYEE